MGGLYIPEKTASGAVIQATELAQGRLNLGGDIPPGATLASSIIIDDGSHWHAKLFTFNALQGKIHATIYWDYNNENIVLFHSDTAFTFCDDVLLIGDGTKILRLELKNVDVNLTQQAVITVKYDTE